MGRDAGRTFYCFAGTGMMMRRKAYCRAKRQQ